MLHISKNSRTLIILVIHCPTITLENTQEVMSLGLTNTEAYVNHVFQGSEVYIYRNGVLSVHFESRLLSGRHGKFVAKKTGLYLETTGVQAKAAWNLERISTRSLHQETEAYLYNGDGTGVDVYILDTGILASHAEFDGGRATFLHNAIPDGIMTDCNGHGTHVAGIVGSRTYGVAKNVHLYGVRVLNCSGDGSIDDILEGADVIIEKAASQPPGRRGVINLSLGGDKSDVIERMVKSLREAGLVVVLAAGNSGRDACEYSPSGMGLNNYALTVGASDRDDQRTSWSNYGSCVSITAPGKDITSTWYTTDTAIATISGTSMAAPAVTGVAALVLQQLVELGLEEKDKAALVDTVNRLIIKWATPNIVAGATPTGGGKSLLYSVINVRLPPAEVNRLFDEVPPASSSSPPPPPPPPRQQRPGYNDPHRHQSSDSASIGTGSGLLLCIALTVLWFTCIV